MTPSPEAIRLHWRNVQALKHLAEAMPPGPGQKRIQARYEVALADHRVWARGQP